MEILVALAIVVGLYWAFTAKRTSQAAIRYQVHKDALVQAERFLERYHHEFVPSESDDAVATVDFFDVSSTDIEVREFLVEDLEDLAVHVRTTKIPTELGNAELLSELLQALERTRVWSDGPIRPAARAEMRRRAIDKIFGPLEELVRDFNPRFGSTQIERIESWIPIAEESLTWKMDGEKLTKANAKAILSQAKALLDAQR